MTEEYIRRLEEYYRFSFPKELKEELFSQLGQVPEPYEYSEQDLWEQSRKIIVSFGRTHINNFKF